MHRMLAVPLPLCTSRIDLIQRCNPCMIGPFKNILKNLRRGERKPAAHLPLFSTILFTPRLFNTFHPYTFHPEILHPETLLSQKLHPYT
jgi:hypothetical protein